MRRSAILWLSCKELGRNWLLFALSFVLLATTLAAAFFISTASSNMMQVFYDYANTMSPDEQGFLITLGGLRYSSLELVEDLPLDEVYPEYLGSVDGEDFSVDGNTLESRCIYAAFVVDDAYEVTEGIPFTDTENSSECAWISRKIADELDLGLGDHLTYRSGTDFETSYAIAGIYDDADVNKDVILPFETYYRSEISAGRNVNHEMYGVLSDSRDYASVVDTMRERKLSPYSVLDDSFQSLTLIHALFQVVFAVILVMGLWTFSNICGVILESRFRFVMKLRMLGIRTSHIAMAYAMIIMLITFLAFVLVAILNQNFSAFIREIATSLYPGVQSETVPVHYQFLAGATASVVILGRSIYRLVRRIETYNIIGVLEEK